MEVVVTRKGQVTIPAKYRRKYGIVKGMKLAVEEGLGGIVLKPIPRIEDLAGVDSGKIGLEEALKMLDKMRAQDRY